MLRDARERRGVSLRQIASATKISVAALDALERNDISRLPGGIFSRAFVRSYAIEVGLDPEAMIQAFIAQFPNDAAVTAGHPVSDRVDDHDAVESERRTAGTFLWLAVIGVPLVAGLLYLTAAGVRKVVDPRAAAAAAVAARTAPAGELTVGFSVTRPCWVSATVDGQKAFERQLHPGEQHTVGVRREMVLMADDAAALAMTFNGAEARPLGKAGEVVTLRLNPTNFKNYLQAR
jgi:cytoskeleton protein RodZ